jgi:hypothetical protein
VQGARIRSYGLHGGDYCIISPVLPSYSEILSTRLQLIDRVNHQARSEADNSRKALAWEVKMPQTGSAGISPIVTKAMQRIANTGECP